MAEHLCQLFIWQGINNHNIQRNQKLNSKRTNNPTNKWANELNRQFFKGNKYMWKCSISLDIKGVQVKTTLRFHLKHNQNGNHQESKKSHILVRVRVTVGGTIDECSHYGNQTGDSSKN
jgi:hypothetical protein